MSEITTLRVISISTLIASLSGCAPPTDNQANNACEFLSHNPYHLQSIVSVTNDPRTQARILATINIESGHHAYARPVDTWYLKPYIAKRYHSSSQGYAQSTDATWRDASRYYRRSMYRLSYYDNLLFIKWYYQTRLRYISKTDMNEENLYLIYHEGPSGYKRYKARQKSVPVRTAKRFSSLSNTMTKELVECQSILLWQNQWLSG